MLSGRKAHCTLPNDHFRSKLTTTFPTRDPSKGFPLRIGEESQPGLHLAIDAEFVKIQNEEYTISVSGERHLLRPARLSPGRVSCLRIASTPQSLSSTETTDAAATQEANYDTIPFVDDYILVPEPIVNYSTKYSGLVPGDLSPTHSPYALQTLKYVYKKLWLLLNLGATFVGHGLDSDFRVLNIFVPPTQIIDTVKLFHRPEAKRYISLRFLAWFYLKDEAFQRGNHDSIVDAETALRLWRVYRGWEEDEKETTAIQTQTQIQVQTQTQSGDREIADTEVLTNTVHSNSNSNSISHSRVTQKLKLLYRQGPQTDWLPPEEYKDKMRALRAAAAAAAGTSASLAAVLGSGSGTGTGGGSASGFASGRITPEPGFGSGVGLAAAAMVTGGSVGGSGSGAGLSPGRIRKT